MELRAEFETERPVVGMVHLPPLPGAPRYDGDRDALVERATRDATTLETGGVDGLIVENFGDAPFYPETVPSHVVATMTDLVGRICETIDLPVGVNVLRNDAEAALSIAAATDASFVRVNIHTGARVTDQGLIEGRAHETIRLRERLGDSVAVLADLDVKHSAPIGQIDGAADTLADTVERGLADGVIVSGRATGERPAVSVVEATVSRREELGLESPVFVGSGVSPDTVADYLDAADGVIVGSAFKEDGVASNPVEPARVTALMDAARL